MVLSQSGDSPTVIVGGKRYRCITMHQDLIGAVHDVMARGSIVPIWETRKEWNKQPLGPRVIWATGVPELLYRGMRAVPWRVICSGDSLMGCASCESKRRIRPGNVDGLSVLAAEP